MADQKLSAQSRATVAVPADVATLYLAGYDLNRAAGDRNIHVSATDIVTLAVNQAVAKGLGGVSTQTLVQTGLVTAIGASSSYLLYAPLTGDTNDVLLLYLDFAMASISGGTFSFQVWAGNPATAGSKVLFTSGTLTGFTAHQAINQLIPYSSGTNQAWVKVTNKGQSALMLNLQVSAMEIPGAGQILGAWVPPVAYTGPLLMDVYVTPADPVFPEPVFAVRALADGGTMHIDTGTYFIPFGLQNLTSMPAGSTFNMSQRTLVTPYGYSGGATTGGVDVQLGLAGTADHGFSSFSIKGNGAYKTIFNGRGGGGNGHRLFYSKCFFYVQVPGTIQDCGFINCGGVWGGNATTSITSVEDAEAGIWVENFLADATLAVLRCSFDNNANGICDATGATNDGTTRTIASNGAGAYVNTVLDSCDFGLRSSNGAEGSGGAHNMYLRGHTLAVLNCVIYGINNQQLSDYGLNKAGNSIKSRCQSTTITNSYVQSQDGRIDIPEGGHFSMSGGTFDCATGGGTDNYFGYCDENTSQTAYNPSFLNVTFAINRFNQTFLVGGGSPIKAVGSGCTVNWYAGNGNVPPTLLLTRDGTNSDPTVSSGINWTAPGGTYPAGPAGPGSIAQPGYVVSWP